jgi:hypothetical protein
VKGSANCIAFLILLAGCSGDREQGIAQRAPDDGDGTNSGVQTAADARESPEALARMPTPAAIEAARPRVAAQVLREWRQAENRDECGPVVFTDEGEAGGDPRHANFAGGWAVAFDMPGRRSAYGLAGPGSTPLDRLDDMEQQQRLREQWPHFVHLEALPAPSYAGYGIEGAHAYPADNPEGYGMQSLAYVRVGGQSCTYNVWSKLGRAHLEVLLDGLRVLEAR